MTTNSWAAAWKLTTKTWSLLLAAPFLISLTSRASAGDLAWRVWCDGKVRTQVEDSSAACWQFVAEFNDKRARCQRDPQVAPASCPDILRVERCYCEPERVK